ncbi:MAG: 50S ribosomal protein L10 [Sediminibacterium sp.]|nr:50S ribosomal protein L10 [Sediminibacterium sp.]
MNKIQKNEVIQILKDKFSVNNFFYIADTEQLTVSDMNTIRKECMLQQVEIKIAKNTLIKKALESLDNEKYKEVYSALHNVSSIFFSENPKSPAIIIKDFRSKKKGRQKPLLKAAYINGDVFLGDQSLGALTKIKTKNEMIGEIIGLLQSPAQRIIGGLLNRNTASTENSTETTTTITTETKPDVEAESNS